MDKSINVMLVDNNEQQLNSVNTFFKEDNQKIVHTCSTAQEALDYLKDNKVDVIVTDLILPNIDGFMFMNKLKEMNCNSKIIVLSALNGDGFIQRAFVLGATYYMVKPVDYSLLSQRIEDVASDQLLVKNNASVRQPRNKAMDEKITNIFITVGIPAHIKGYQFLREAIKMAIDEPEIINSITKKLYPNIANMFDTSASKVERAIRHAIEVAWNRGKIENINALFGIRVYSNNEKPTNGEFIALVADKMLIEGA